MINVEHVVLRGKGSQMKFFYDLEFSELGPNEPIRPISLGIVGEDNREYYAQASWFEAQYAHPWIIENVFPHLQMCYGDGPYQAQSITESLAVHRAGKCDLYTNLHLPDQCPWRNREEMVKDILAFMDPEKYGPVELWGYYSAYDHVVFCQLFGSMIDLPKGFPMYTRDLKQWCDQLGNPRLPKQEKNEHHALADARWNKQVYEFLMLKELGLNG